MCKKMCCSFWTIVLIILALAAFAAAVYVIINKFNLLGSKYLPMDEGYWPEEENPAAETEADGVPYTTDKDFV